MTSHISGRYGRRLALLVATAAIAIGAGTASAAAATVDATPDSGLSATEATALSVSGSGYEAAGEYRVGLCSSESYGSFGIPACGEMVTVTANGSGQISTAIEVEKTTLNVHSEIPFPLNLGQPKEFTCAGDPEDDECEVVVAAHGGSKEVLAAEAVSFE